MKKTIGRRKAAATLAIGLGRAGGSLDAGAGLVVARLLARFGVSDAQLVNAAAGCGRRP